MNISIVIPNYNGRTLLEKNLPKVIAALGEYEKGNHEIIIVDDCSKDDSVSFIEGFEKTSISIRLLKNEKNLGFSPTVNKGVENAKGEIVILLNTDVAPEKNFVEPLIKHFKEKQIFAVGCVDKSIENGKTVLRGRGLGHWERGFLIHRRGEVDKTSTLWVSGGSGAFRKDIWDKLGGLNELYAPFYYEDIDMSYRALKSGYKVLFEPKSIVVHEHEEGAIKREYEPKKVKRIAYRNQFIFAWENATDYTLQVSECLWLPYHLIKAVLRMDVPFILAFFDSLILLPKVIKSSLSYQKFFIKKDSEVIQNLSL